MSMDRTTASTLPPALPVIRKINISDLREALYEGWDDFKHKPSHVFFLGILYPVIGLLLGRLAFGYDILPLLFPLAAGFALLGPFAALAFYDISRRREQGMDTSWWKVFSIFRYRSIGAILAIGVLLMVIFLIWLWTAETIYTNIFGHAVPASADEFRHEIFETAEGRRLMLVGNLVGFGFALLSFIISAISFPFLLDHDASAAEAILTSIRAVLKNPITMAVWAIIIAAALIIGSLPMLLGLVIVVPVLGHASWHLYRKIVPKP